MRNKVIFFLTVFYLLSFISANAMAVPAQRGITVIDSQKKVVYQDYIKYSNTYVQPQIKIPKTSTTTTSNKTATNATAAPKSNTQVSRSDNSELRLVLKSAYDLLGRNYVYGASGPNSFDCSGFTRYVFNKININLPHNAASQFNYGVKVKRNELLPGDLVFFSYYGQSGINHVGIYVGEGTFIHASTSKGVIKTSLNSSYYVANYKGATRLLR